MSRGPRLHTTTIRFDRRTWAAIVAQADDLGVANAEFIRSAGLLHLGRRMAQDRFDRLQARHDELAKRLERTVNVVLVLARLAGLPASTAVGSEHG